MKIRTISGKWDATCTTSSNLTENAIKKPAYREVMEYAERRMLTTLIVSGVKWGDEAAVGNAKVKSKIGMVPDGKLIGSSELRYKVMGRIQRASVINSQIGTSQVGGTFVLSMKDNLLYEGMNVMFYDTTQARVTSNPVGSQNNYVVNFQTIDGSTFNYATAVAVQAGELTCFGGGTSYSEGSVAGYSRSMYPDEYVGHLTTQRKTVSMTGDALTDVTWITMDGGNEFKPFKSWYFTKERQQRAVFALEDEWMKWNGQSSMRDAFGNLRATSTMGNDPVTGNPIIQGDGLINQIQGANDMVGSDPSGFATIDDFTDMMTLMEKKSDNIDGNHWYVVTGTDGWVNAQNILRDYWYVMLGGRMNSNSGDKNISVGANFSTLEYAGNMLTFVKNTQWDDAQKFPQRAPDGKLTQSGLYLFLYNGLNSEGKNNIEILSKGSFGINRSFIDQYRNGITGFPGKTSISPVDAMSYDMLKQDGIFAYNTMACGMITKAAA